MAASHLHRWAWYRAAAPGGDPRFETYPTNQIKRVRLVRRADGYYVQFGVQAQRRIVHAPTGKHLGIDVGLAAFLTDSDGHAEPNPRYLRAAESKLKRLHRRVSRKKKGSQNRAKARKRLARRYLHVSRQREDHARKLAGALIHSCDWIAYEDLRVRNLVKNRSLAKASATRAGDVCDGGWCTMPGCMGSWRWPCRPSGRARTVRAAGGACASR